MLRSASVCLRTCDRGFAGAAHSEPEMRDWKDMTVVEERDYCTSDERGVQVLPAGKSGISRSFCPSFRGNYNMLPRRSFVIFRSFLTRNYASGSSPHALVFLEHRQGDIDSGSLSALTAASQLGGKVAGLVVGSSEFVPTVVDKVKKYVILDNHLFISSSHCDSGSKA